MTRSASMPPNRVTVRLSVRHARIPAETYQVDGNEVAHHKGEITIHCPVWHVSDIRPQLAP